LFRPGCDIGQLGGALRGPNFKAKIGAHRAAVQQQQRSSIGVLLPIAL
jgi:hypothetical protein